MFILSLTGINKPSEEEKQRVLDEYMRNAAVAYPMHFAEGAAHKNNNSNSSASSSSSSVAAPARSWDDVSPQDKTSARRLGVGDVFEAVFKKLLNTSYNKDNKTERHHIVPQKAGYYNLRASQEVLEKVGIAVTGFSANAQPNLVVLSYGSHKFLHNDFYGSYVNLNIPVTVPGIGVTPMYGPVAARLAIMATSLRFIDTLLQKYL